MVEDWEGPLAVKFGSERSLRLVPGVLEKDRKIHFKKRLADPGVLVYYKAVPRKERKTKEVETMKVKVNGREYIIESKEDLHNMMVDHFEDWYAVRTANAELLQMQLELYLDELDKQDAKNSTGSYGKLKEVLARIDQAIKARSRMYLHDVRCRRQNQDDQRIGNTRIEHKSGFAQWAYGPSEQACWEELEHMVLKGIIFSWDPFKDEREIVMPIGQLLDYLASYSPKGLKVWFSYKPARHQLQLQPVTNSAKRRAWIEALLED